MTSTQLLYCYHTPPIDFWYGALNHEQLFDVIAHHSPSMRWLVDMLDEIEAVASAAQSGFKQVGWEGDISEGPFFFFVPSELEMKCGYVLKQSNNGSTFVASPHPMPWLAEHSMTDHVVVELAFS